MLPLRLLFMSLGFLLATTAHAGDAIAIKFRKPQPGDSYFVEVTSNTKGGGKVVDKDDNQLFEKGGTQESTAAAYRETVLTVKDAKLASFRREYKSGQKKSGDKAEEFPFLGKAIVIEKLPDKYYFHRESGPQLLGKDAAILEAEFNENDFGDDGMDPYLPEKPVRVGDSWPVKKSSAFKRFNEALGNEKRPQFDEARSEGTCTLLRAYKSDGHLHGVIKIVSKFHTKPGDFVMAGEAVQLQPGSHVSTTMILDCCIDGNQGPGQFELVVNMNLNYTLPNLAGDALLLKMTAQSMTHRKWRK